MTVYQGKNNNILQPNVAPRQGRIADQAALPIVLEVDRGSQRLADAEYRGIAGVATRLQ
jgi:hypothetical protein